MKIDNNNVTAIILAGGKGRRLEGQDKGLITYQNKMLIQHVIERIQPQVSNIIINANRNQEIYKGFGYPVIPDKINDFQGPLAGLASVMPSVKTNYIVTLPCDGPALPPDFITRMLLALNNACLPDAIAVAHDGTRMQPVHALIPMTLMASLENFLSKGHRKVTHWYSEQVVFLVDFSDQPNAFFNINKKEQLIEHNSDDN